MVTPITHQIDEECVHHHSGDVLCGQTLEGSDLTDAATGFTHCFVFTLASYSTVASAGDRQPLFAGCVNFQYQPETNFHDRLAVACQRHLHPEHGCLQSARQRSSIGTRLLCNKKTKLN